MIPRAEGSTPPERARRIGRSAARRLSAPLRPQATQRRFSAPLQRRRSGVDLYRSGMTMFTGGSCTNTGCCSTTVTRSTTRGWTT
jgi:hypothetical protein